MRLTQLSAAFVALLMLAGVAHAQLLVGNDDVAAGNDQAWDVDPVTGNAVVLWGTDTGPEVWGMTYDPGNREVYVNDGSDLYAGPVGSGPPSLVGVIADPAGAPQSMVGLAWANGGLYSSRNIANEAIYSIDLNTLVATVALDYDDPSYDFGGIAYNPLDGLFYGTNDDATPNGSGLYSLDVFGTGDITLVTPYPAGETDIDGLAVGNNIAYLVEDEAGETIHPFDLLNGVYLPSVTSPMGSSEIFSGAAWVPEPSSLGALAVLMGLVAFRRRP